MTSSRMRAKTNYAKTATKLLVAMTRAPHAQGQALRAQWLVPPLAASSSNSAGSVRLARSEVGDMTVSGRRWGRRFPTVATPTVNSPGASVP